MPMGTHGALSIVLMFTVVVNIALLLSLLSPLLTSSGESDIYLFKDRSITRVYLYKFRRCLVDLLTFPRW